jgi:hypothetical protein
MLCKHDWSHAGYDAEELYFEKLNRELITKIRAEQDQMKGKLDTERPLAEVIPFPGRKRNPEADQKKAA